MDVYYDYKEDDADKLEYYTYQLNRAIERMDSTAIAYHSAKVQYWVNYINEDVADSEIKTWFAKDDHKERG